jgi:hypothetical protein
MLRFRHHGLSIINGGTNYLCLLSSLVAPLKLFATYALETVMILAINNARHVIRYKAAPITSAGDLVRSLSAFLYVFARYL